LKRLSSNYIYKKLLSKLFKNCYKKKFVNIYKKINKKLLIKDYLSKKFVNKKLFLLKYERDKHKKNQ